ncbi:hypothetical protein ABKV19_005928 [Rosa sericea]
MGYIDGSIPCPPQYKITKETGITPMVTEEYKEWRKHDSAVMTLLASTLSYDALSFIVGSKTSKEVWSSLYERYAKLSKFKAFELQASMQKIRKGKDSIDKYMERFKTVRDQLSASGVFIPDEDIVFLILNGLPVDFAAIKTIIRVRTTPISLSELRTMLLDVESDIVQESRSFAPASMLEHKALPSSSLTAMIAQNILANSSQSMQYGIPRTWPSSQAIFPSHYTGYSSMTHSLQTATSNVGFLPNVTNTNLIPGIPAYDHYNTSSRASNVHHYNAPPPSSTTHFGIPHNSMISSSALSMPNAPPNCQDLLPFTTNVGVPQSVPNSGYMLHNNVGNENYFSSSAPSYGYAPQNGSSTSYVQRSNLNHNGAQQHGNFSQQNVQPGTFNNSSQQNNGFSRKEKFSSQAMPYSASLSALRNAAFAASVSFANKISTPAQAQDGNNSYVTTELQGNENLKTDVEKIVQDTFACETDMDVGAAAENFTKSCQEVVKGVDGDDSKKEDIRVDKLYVYSRSMNKVDTKEAEGSLQHALLKKIEALATPGTWLLPSIPDRNLMNCRQACESTNLWRLLPLIPPG